LVIFSSTFNVNSAGCTVVRRSLVQIDRYSSNIPDNNHIDLRRCLFTRVCILLRIDTHTVHYSGREIIIPPNTYMSASGAPETHTPPPAECCPYSSQPRSSQSPCSPWHKERALSLRSHHLVHSFLPRPTYADRLRTAGVCLPVS
jgi:hypothetical protein